MQCNGEFLDHFAPIPGVKFLRSPPSWAPAPDRVNHCHHEIKDTPAEVEGYGLLHPSPALRSLLEARVRECAPSFVAVHVRRTDMLTWAAVEPGCRYQAETTDAKFDAFLEAHAGLRVYVATDCGATHARFAQRYAQRIGVQAHRTFSRGSHRQTSLSDAVLDLFVCAASTHFMGSYGSSFSDAIMQMRRARGDASAEDRHERMYEADWAGRSWVGPALRERRE